MIIYLDFDGTVVEHEYPKMGRCNYGCFEIIKKLQDAGHEIILNTFRSECNNDTLKQALSLINEKAFMLIKDRSKRDEFNLIPIKSTKAKIDPAPWDIESYKFHDVMFIDDISSGTPLKKACMVKGFMVDWDELDKRFEEAGIYNKI